MKYLRVSDWDKVFESALSRKIDQLPWIRMPNRHDGDSYIELVSHPNGTAHYGCWALIVQVASRCNPRGFLVRKGGLPHDAASIARVTRGDEAMMAEAIGRLLEIGWLVEVDASQVPHRRSNANTTRPVSAIERRSNANTTRPVSAIERRSNANTSKPVSTDTTRPEHRDSKNPRERRGEERREEERESPYAAALHPEPEVPSTESLSSENSSESENATSKGRWVDGYDLRDMLSYYPNQSAPERAYPAIWRVLEKPEAQDLAQKLGYARSPSGVVSFLHNVCMMFEAVVHDHPKRFKTADGRSTVPLMCNWLDRGDWAIWPPTGGNMLTDERARKAYVESMLANVQIQPEVAK